MRALRATITVLLDPRVIGPDAPEFNGDGTAEDYMSEVLTFQQTESVLDWSYTNWRKTDSQAWEVIEVDPTDYEEGEAV